MTVEQDGTWRRQEQGQGQERQGQWGRQDQTGTEGLLVSLLFPFPALPLPLSPLAPPAFTLPSGLFERRVGLVWDCSLLLLPFFSHLYLCPTPCITLPASLASSLLPLYCTYFSLPTFTLL